MNERFCYTYLHIRLNMIYFNQYSKERKFVEKGLNRNGKPFEKMGRKALEPKSATERWRIR